MHPCLHSTLLRVEHTWSSVLPISGRTPGSLQKLNSSTPLLRHVECPPNPHSDVLPLVPLTLEIARSPVEPDQGCTGGGGALLCSYWSKTVELLMMCEEAHSHGEGPNHFWLIPTSHETFYDTKRLCKNFNSDCEASICSHQHT